MKKVLRKSKLTLTVAIFMAIWLALSGVATAQGSIRKEEDIYVSLENNGAFISAYVVNCFTLNEPTVIEDYGDYDKVTNLTTVDGLKVEGERITVNAPKGRFYYQGNISSLELPWSFDMSYKLDGREISPQELSGVVGSLDIAISIKPNPKAIGDFDKHYAVQTIVTLDSSLCSDIEAEGATIANAGKDKTISFNMLPGNGALYKIRANVEDFRMDSIRFAAVPFSFSLDAIDRSAFDGQLSKIKQLSGGIEELDKGADKLKSGTADFTDGTASLRNGMKGWQSGLIQLNDSFSNLTMQNNEILTGSEQIKNGLLSVANSLPQEMLQLKGALENLAQSYTELHNGLTAYMGATEEISKGYQALNENYSQLIHAGDQLYSGTSELYKGSEQLAAGTQQLRQGTLNMDTEIEKAINELMDSYSGGEFEPTSFIAPQNSNVDAVQFVMQTSAIEKKPVKVEIDEQKEKTTFWQKLLALFGL